MNSSTIQITPEEQRSIAILYFRNDSDDESLDWLRRGLTDMLVTDLSQSPHIEVLGTETLYQILKEMDRLDEQAISLEVVQEVADRSRVANVLLGSFTRAGDKFRISARLQEAESGKIITSERVEGTGESAIFPMVDDLTRRIKTELELQGLDSPDTDRDLVEITTDSVEAYKIYAAGLHLAN